jgi:hypothetical protein
MAATGGSEAGDMMVGAGRWDIRVPIVINMTKSFVAKPINVPLDVYYGVNQDLTLGLTHSGGVVQSTSPYPLMAGLCLTGKSDGCAKFYNTVGADALYRLLGSSVQLAAHGGLDFRTLDPARLALRLGVLMQAPLTTNLAILFDPRVWIGLTKRDDPPLGNKEYLALPLALQFWATPELRLAARTVFGGPFSHFGDNYVGSVGLYGAYAINQMIEAFLAFDFLNLYGKNSSGDFRTLVVGANFRI